MKAGREAKVLHGNAGKRPFIAKETYTRCLGVVKYYRRLHQYPNRNAPIFTVDRRQEGLLSLPRGISAAAPVNAAVTIESGGDGSVT
jgi:hypothetical protein